MTFASLDYRAAAAAIKAKVTVEQLAQVFGYDYSLNPGRSESFPCPACESVSASKKTLRIYGPDRWYCFHCAEGGDQIDWLAARLRVSKGAAIMSLVDRLGIDLSTYSSNESLADALISSLTVSFKYHAAHVPVIDLHTQANRLWYKSLRNTDDPRMVIERAATLSAIEQVAAAASSSASLKALGVVEQYAAHPDDPQVIDSVRVFLDNNHRSSAMRAIRQRWIECKREFAKSSAHRQYVERRGVGAIGKYGVSRRGRFGGLWQGRLVLPIRNLRGEVVALAGRVIVDRPGSPKWINSPNGPQFVKSHTLYGLDHAARKILRGDPAVLVEGYFDVLACRAAGLAAVSACGTALTTLQASTLKRLGCSRAVVMFDGDEAGRVAVRRAADVLIGARITPTIARLPRGHDPDDLTASELRALVARRRGDVEQAVRVLGGG